MILYYLIIWNKKKQYKWIINLILNYFTIRNYHFFKLMNNLMILERDWMILWGDGTDLGLQHWWCGIHQGSSRRDCRYWSFRRRWKRAGRQDRDRCELLGTTSWSVPALLVFLSLAPLKKKKTVDKVISIWFKVNLNVLMKSAGL